MSLDQAPFWRRLVRLVARIFTAFGVVILMTLVVWFLVYFGLRYFFSGPNWQTGALLATLVAGMFVMQMLGEALIEGVFRGSWWGLKAIWRRCRSWFSR